MITPNELRVANPCQSTEWADKSDDSRARLCTTCNKNVYNVSLMTLAESNDLIREKEGKLCISIYKSFKGKTLTADAPKGFRFLRKKYLIARAKTIAFALMIWGFITGTTSCYQPITVGVFIPHAADVNGKPKYSYLRAINDTTVQEIMVRTYDSTLWIFIDSTELAPGTYTNHRGVFAPGGYRDTAKLGSYIWYDGELKITSIDNNHAVGTFWFNASDSTIHDTVKVTNGSFDVYVNYGKIPK